MGFIGQKPIVEGFKDRIKNNAISHAYALTGPAGIGKKTLGSYLAKMLLCSDNTAPCNVCRSCACFDAGSNPNIKVIRSETQKILIKQIREMIEDISLRPGTGRKVYLIEEADRMTVDAQNCLLKTLEEPPAYAVIILTTSLYSSLLSTVKSRTVEIKLKSYSTDEIKAIVRSKGIESSKDYLLSWSQGNPGRMIKLINNTTFEENRESVMKFLFSPRSLGFMDFNLYLSKNKESFSECMDILESFYRDAILIASNIYDGLINCDKKDNIVEYAKGLTLFELTEKIRRVHEIRSSLKRNMNYQLAVDIVTLGIDAGH